MVYIHVTTKESATNIIKTCKIKNNELCLSDLLDNYIERLTNIYETEGPKFLLEELEGELTLFSTPRYLYLGEGIYCFNENDYQTAQSYGHINVCKSPCYVKINTSSNEKKCDLNNCTNLEKIKNFLEFEFLKKYMINYPNISESVKECFNYIIQVLLYQLESIGRNNFQPFALGVAVDISREHSNDRYDSYHFTFPKRETDYVVIKNNDIITSFEEYA